MNKTIAVFSAIIAMAFTAQAQQSEPRFTGSAWLDAVAGPSGAVIYPQYTWSAQTSAGKFGGYGFLESAPKELLFSNNLVNFTPKKTPWFTVHGEIGGLPAKQKGFVQLGPRVNIPEVVPALRKAFPVFFVAYLPAFEGIRTDNTLFAGQSRKVPVGTQKVTVHVEAFNRVFRQFSYGELWVVSDVRGWKHVHPVVHVIRDTSRNPVYTTGFGFRFTP